MLEARRTRTRLVSGPVYSAVAGAKEPVTPEEVYAALDIGGDTGASYNTQVADLIEEARAYFERATHRTIKRQSATVRYEGTDLPVVLPGSPIVAVTALTTYYEGAATVDDAGDVYVMRPSGLRPTLYMTSAGSWDATNIQSFEVTYTCGFALDASDVPADVKRAIKTLVRDWFDKPGSFETGTLLATTPRSVEAIIARYRAIHL